MPKSTPMTFNDYLILEFIKTGLALVVLVVTWFFGQRILAYWELKKKRKELDIATATQFQHLYGEYKQLWRLWKVFSNRSEYDLLVPDHTRWELLQRATAAESSVEAVIVKLTTERAINKTDIETLGLFRQAYQQLRQGIRDNKTLRLSHESPEYILFNELSDKVACLIMSGKQIDHPVAKVVIQNHKQIVDFRSRHWTAEIEKTRGKYNLPQAEDSQKAKDSQT